MECFSRYMFNYRPLQKSTTAKRHTPTCPVRPSSLGHTANGLKMVENLQLLD